MRTVDIQEQEIFFEAMEIESRLKRKDFVYQACGQNKNLLKRVEKLLELRDDEEFILDKQIHLDAKGQISAVDRMVADLSGTAIGNYNLVRKIGSGGMGDVYLAEQWQPIRRRVAVKIIKLGMDSARFLERFALEQKTLALMDHPGISKVFDAGISESGRPYFVMELISGKSITKYCDEERLTIEQRLDLFIGLCKAIQHAHQKGIIHRDLKPSNIIVASDNSEPIPKVIDFGVSKANLDRSPGQTNLTQSTVMIGTPEYMSPEQTDTQSNDQDVRTDIYSLGAILFELLTGTTPFENEGLSTRSLVSVREIIQTRRPEACSTRIPKLVDKRPEVFRNRGTEPAMLVKSLTGNLDSVVRKCLEKDREQRYNSAAELIEELERHLGGELLEIAQQSVVSRFKFYYERNRTPMFLGFVGTAIFLGLLLFTILNTLYIKQLSRELQDSTALVKSQSRQVGDYEQKMHLLRLKLKRLETSNREQAMKLRRDIVLLTAVTRFQDSMFTQSDSRSDNGWSRQRWGISNWLKQRLGNSALQLVSTSNTAIEQSNRRGKDEQEDESTGSVDSVIEKDVAFLNVLMQEQQREFGNESEWSAATLDLLGEKLMAKGETELAAKSLQESLYLRAQYHPASPDRIWTLVLLSRALKKMDDPIKSATYADSARAMLKRHPDSKYQTVLLEE